jgi:hypothetical protein
MSTPEAAQPQWSPLPGAHYLHAEKSSRVPRRYVFYDTEALSEHGVSEERQTWRCGVTACVSWRPSSRTWSPIETVRHDTPESLWATIAGFARPDARTVVVAHRAGYDLRISRAFEVLPGLGWEVAKLTLSGEHVGLDMTKDGATICIIDSSTTLVTSMETLASWQGHTKGELPADDAPAEAWWARCELDVSTLAWAYMEVVDWMTRDDLGCWGRTGSALGWHTLLRNHLDERVLVHGIEGLLKTEGESCYAGRAEAWQPGDWHGTELVEWDYELAYCHVAETTSLPARYIDQVRGTTVERMADQRDKFAYLVEATVETDVPMLPFRDHHGVCWPVGRFDGTWWAGELAEAVTAGVRVKVHWAWRYNASPWLASWASWAREQVVDRSTPEAKVRSLVAKHWTRCVVGRAGMRFKAWEERGPAWVPGVNYWRLADLDNGKVGVALQLGDQRFEAWDERWWDSALPSVLSAVMSELRVRLWRAMVAAGLENVVYCDTDCILVGSAGDNRLNELVVEGELPGLRRKSRHDDLEVMAPQLVEGSSYRRLSGVPRKATRVGEHSYESQRWASLTTSLAEGDPGAVRIAALHQDLELIDWRRRHGDARTSEPYRVVDGQRELPVGNERSGARPSKPRPLRPFSA